MAYRGFERDCWKRDRQADRCNALLAGKRSLWRSQLNACYVDMARPFKRAF
jgi:hypothetical protein